MSKLATTHPNEQQRTVWLLSTPACAEINDAMQHFTGIIYESSEQHKEATPARLEKDFKDASKIKEYVVTISPFSEDSDLINIHTEEVADKSVNVDNSFNVVMEILKSMHVINVPLKKWMKASFPNTRRCQIYSRWRCITF